MMMRTWLALTATAAVALGGCDMYFGGGDDEPCKAYGYGEAAPSQQVRNPYTGTCDYIGGWEGCDDTCGPCPAYDVAYPDQASCSSACTGLDEVSCQATPGCYASYQLGLLDAAWQTYEGCWATAPSGPVGGSCANLDAQECSRHDNCGMTYENGKFAQCIDEPAVQYCYSDLDCGGGNARCDTSQCYADPSCQDGMACPAVCYGVCVNDAPSCAAVDCGPGYHCEEQCYPTDGPNGPVMSYCNVACVPDYQNSCANVDCGPGYECIESCEAQGGGDAIWCGTLCVPVGGDPGSCYGQVACDMAPPACPTGTTPGVLNACYTGYCIPNAACGPNDPGDCYGAVSCDQAAPACPANTTAGIANGCYTGYCIPNNQCGSAPCETLTTESSCAARMDCSPVYTGSNCTCTPNGCTCESTTFARCESWLL